MHNEKTRFYVECESTYGTKQSKKYSCTREASVNSLKTLLGPIAASGYVFANERFISYHHQTF